MGLLDYLSAPDAGNGIGGLLSYLQSPLYRAPEAAPAPQPQYDAMGNYTGITPDAPNPFGPLPQANTPSPFQQPSVFNGGAPASPIAGLPTGQPAPALPPAQTIAAAPQPVDPQRTMSVGGYQMPQIGSAADYAPVQTAQAAPTDVSAQSRGQAGPAPAFLQPPSQGGFGGAFRGFAANAQAGPIGMLLGAIGGAAGMGRGNPQDIAQQNLTAQYHSLRQALEANGDSKQQAASKAMLAVMNPDAAKTIIPELFTNKEKFTEIGIGPDGTKQYGFVNDRDQTVTPYKMQGGETAGTVTGPDGKQIAIPPGVDRKTFVNEISRANAKAQAGEKTEVQAKSEKFANKMETAEKNLSGIVNEGTSVAGRGLDMVPGGNFLQSNNYQKYRQAQDNFITALLRDESGAAIGTAEFKRYERELFPQPGDGPAVIAQKAEARKTAIEAMKKSAGPGYKPPEGAGPQVGSVQMGYRFKGGNPADRNSWERAQ